MKRAIILIPLIFSLSCTTLDFSAIEDSWSFDEFRKYAILRCTAIAFQNEEQFEIARQYYVKSESLLATSHHPARIYYHLNEQAKIAAYKLDTEQSGEICMDWVLSSEFEMLVIKKLSSPT